MGIMTMSVQSPEFIQKIKKHSLVLYPANKDEQGPYRQAILAGFEGHTGIVSLSEERPWSGTLVYRRQKDGSDDGFAGPESAHFQQSGPCLISDGHGLALDSLVRPIVVAPSRSTTHAAIYLYSYYQDCEGRFFFLPAPYKVHSVAYGEIQAFRQHETKGKRVSPLPGAPAVDASGRLVGLYRGPAERGQTILESFVGCGPIESAFRDVLM